MQLAGFGFVPNGMSTIKETLHGITPIPRQPASTVSTVWPLRFLASVTPAGSCGAVFRVR
jgi:hypothetical protein